MAAIAYTWLLGSIGAVSPHTVISARYMTRFQCLGGDCEATCCGGGVIPVSETTHRRLNVLASGDPAARELLERGIEVTPPGPEHGRIRFLDSGECAMRDERGLCRVHTRFGHAELFEVCATYPRYASEVDDEIELFGTLACPEVARLALLADDGFELAALALDEPPRVFRNRFRTDKPYFKPFKQVRAALIRLLCESRHALPEKLFVMLWLSDKLKAALHRDCAPIPPVVLEQALSTPERPEVLDELAQSYRGLELDGTLPISVIVAALRPPREPRRGAQTEAFDALWRKLEARYGASLAPGHESSESELGQVWARYRQARRSLPDRVSQRIDVCLMRYAVNHLLTTPHMLSSDLFEYAYDLVLRLASLCFLLSSRLVGFGGDAVELDRAIVEVTYSFVRTVEHADLPSELRRLLREQRIDGLAHAVCFLSIWAPTAG